MRTGRIGITTALFDRKFEYRIRSVACLFDERAGLYDEFKDYAVLLRQLQRLQVSQASELIVQQYLALPDRRNTGKGMIASGSLSTLLGAVTLTSLDRVMAAEIRTGRIW